MNVYILPMDLLDNLSNYIEEVEATVVIDTRHTKYGSGCVSVVKIQNACKKHKAKYMPSVRLSEAESPESQYTSGSVSKISLMGESVILIGGTCDLNTNHLVYNIGYRFFAEGNDVNIFTDTDYISLSESGVCEGGYFGELGTFNPKTIEGDYYKILIDTLFSVRLSENYILRDFMLTADSMVYGVPNYPDYPSKVIEAGKELCVRLIEPVREQFGQVSITYGYKNYRGMEKTKPNKNPKSSEPHQWDRGTFGNQIYVRVDLLPVVVSTGEVTRSDFCKWLMYNLDIDLLMEFQRSDSVCITLSNKPRRVWLEWVKKGKGTNGGNSLYKMGEHYWNNIYPTEKTKPVFAPSMTGGKMFNKK